MTRALGCELLYFIPSGENKLTHFETTDLHDFQTSFHSIDFCRLETSLKYQLFPVLHLLLPTRRRLHQYKYEGFEIY